MHFPSRGFGSLGGVALAGGILAAACADDLPTGSTSVADCAAGDGQTHSGMLSGSQIWTVRNGPHLLIDSVTTSGTITIEAGAVVCGRQWSVLAPAVLRVEGTAEAPVLLTATDAAVGWGGIRGSSSPEEAVIRHAIIRHALAGVRAPPSGQTVVLENTTISGARAAAVTGGTVRMRDVVIDRACTAEMLRCSAVAAGPSSSIELTESTIRDSQGNGITLSQNANVNLAGGEITGSRGIGIHAHSDPRGSPRVGLSGGVRITGGDTIPLLLASALPWAVADRAAQLQVTGNAIDEIHFTAGSAGGTIYRELPWRIQARCVGLGVGFIGTIRLEPGASVTLEAPCDVEGEILGAGTADDPVRIRSDGVVIRSVNLMFNRSIPDSIHLRHAVVTNTRLTFEASRAMIEDVELDGSSISFAAAGSRLTRAEIRGSPEDGVVIAADDIVISDCTVENSTRHGVHVLSGAPRIERCNLVNNGGAGVSNTGTGTVNATDNWWGDDTGPYGPDGDGIGGAVLYVPYRTSRIVH